MIQQLNGVNWNAVNNDRVYVISIDDEKQIVDTLNKFLIQTNIKAGMVSGIGAVNYAKLKFYNFDKDDYEEKEFNEQLEMVNLSGNIAILDGEPLLHLHITLGRSDYTAIAGHLEEARVKGACEIYIHEFPSAIKKVLNPVNGLNIYSF